MKKIFNKAKICGIERFIYTFTIILALTFPLLSVFSKSTLSKVNYDVESVKDEISIQERSNESLQMQINELASLENLEAVAKQQGLSYNSNSVKTIE